jgi:hypothetical protein
MTRDERGTKGDPPDAPLVHLARYSGHGLTIALSTGLFLLVGWWIDGKTGTRPLFTIVGALLGAAGGFYSLLSHLLFLPREREREARRRQGEGNEVAEEPGETPEGRS